MMTTIILAGIIMGLLGYIFSLKKDVKVFSFGVSFHQEKTESLYEQLEKKRKENWELRKEYDEKESQFNEEIKNLRNTSEVLLLKKELELLQYKSSEVIRENVDGLLSSMDVTVTLYRGIDENTPTENIGKWWSTSIKDAEMYAGKYDNGVIYKATFELKAKDYQGFLFIYESGHENHNGWGAIPTCISTNAGNWFFINPAIAPTSIEKLNMTHS